MDGPYPNDMKWRAADLTDAAGLAGLFLAIERAAPIGLETDPCAIRERLSMPRLDLQRDTLIGFDGAGVPLIYAEAADMGTGAGQFRIRLTAALHPEVSDEFVDIVVNWLTRRAQRMRSERQPQMPGVVAARCASGDRARLAALTATGFEVDHWHLEMTRSVAPPVPAPSPLDGIAVVPYEPRYSEATRLAHNDAFEADPHFLTYEARDWPQHAVGLPSFLPDASFLALDRTARSTRVAAFLLSLDHHDATSTRVGLLHSAGTREDLRGKGLATTLAGRALSAFQQMGFTTARLKVCSFNTNVVKGSTKLGFAKDGRGYALLHAPITD